MRTIKKQILFFIAFLLITITNLCAQSISSTSQRNFWVSWGNNYNKPVTNIFFQLKITSIFDADITLTFTQDNSTVPLHVSAGTVVTYALTVAQRALVYSDNTGISDKSLHIESTAPITVYAINPSLTTTDATAVFPVEACGTDYYHIGYRGGNTTDAAAKDGYTIVAVKDGTSIHINGNSSPQAILGKGQVYSYYAPLSATDLTGTRITSNNPIVYFMTHKGTNIPYGRGTIDNLHEQLLSVNKWGTNFLVPTTVQRIGRIRIIASQNGTTVTQNGATGYAVSPSSSASVTSISGTTSYRLNTGQWIELEMKTAGVYISADKPIAVCFYMVGNTHVPSSAGLGIQNGDPALAWIPPIEQTLNEVVISPFIPNGTTNLRFHYAQIITETTTKDQTVVAKGSALPQSLGVTWVDNALSGLSFASYQFPTTTPADSIASYVISNPNGLVVLGYGFGERESYHYLASAAFRDLTAYYTINDYYYTEIDSGQLCNPYYFQAFINYPTISYKNPSADSVQWYIDDVLQTNLTNLMDWHWETDANDPPTLGMHLFKMAVTDSAGVVHDYQTSFEVVESMSIVWTPENNISGTSADKQDWHNPENWTSHNETHIVPTRCADVYIPGDCDWYPILDAAAECNNIYFLQGGELGRPDSLVYYNQARVQLNFGLNQYSQIIDRDSTLVIDSNDTFDRLTFSAARSPILEREQWHILSSPLQNVVSGDYGFGGFPLTYMQKFGPIKAKEEHNLDTTNYIVGKWTGTFSEMSEPIRASEGFAFYAYEFDNGFGIWDRNNPTINIENRGTNEKGSFNDSEMNDLNYFPERAGGEYGLAKLNGILELPFYEDSLMLASHRTQKYESGLSTFYHIADANYGSNPPSQYHNIIGHTDNVIRDTQSSYRFIPEEYKFGKWVFPDTLVHSGAGLGTETEFLVGNPYMSSIDMVEFYKDNQNWIQPQFRVWDGVTGQFISYDISTAGAGSVTPDDSSDPITGRYIAPMQGFFLLTKNDYAGQNIIFVVKNISTVRPVGSSSNLRSQKGGTEDNILRMEAKNSFSKSSALIGGTKNNASNSYQSGEDIYKLFSQIEEVPEVYTLADKMPTAMNFINNQTEITIPIGIKTNQLGKTTLTFSGMSNFSKAKKIEFMDANTGKTIDITNENDFEYSFQNIQKGIQNGRFFVKFYPSQTAINDLNTSSEQIEVYNTQAGISIIANSPIQRITIYDLQGRMVYENGSIHSNVYTIVNDFDTKILIVNVQTEQGNKNVKLMK